MLMGVGGYAFPGFPAYTNSYHTTGVTNGCPTCHMTSDPEAEPYGIFAGGHSFNMEYEYSGSDRAHRESCNTTACHNGGISSSEGFDRITGDHPGGVQTELAILEDSLGMMLVARGRADTVGGGFHPFAGTTYTSSELGALMNLLIVEEDLSHGIHNTDYAFQLIENAIIVLDTLSAPRSDEGISTK
jgi:hypothetical protein